MVCKCDPVGLTEIAERLGKSRGWVDMRHHRGQLPPARWIVGNRPAWDWNLDFPDDAKTSKKRGVK